LSVVRPKNDRPEAVAVQPVLDGWLPVEAVR
jgi:hypothetical protein